VSRRGERGSRLPGASDRPGEDALRGTPTQESAPSPDTPLFADGLRRWERHHCPPEAIAGLMREARFFAQVEVVKCARRVPAADCYAWVESRDWPSLEAFFGRELRRGVTELRDRYATAAEAIRHTRGERNVRGVPPHVASWCYGPMSA